MQISPGAATCWVPGKPGKGKSSFAHLRDILLSKLLNISILKLQKAIVFVFANIYVLTIKNV